MNFVVVNVLFLKCVVNFTRDLKSVLDLIHNLSKKGPRK